MIRKFFQRFRITKIGTNNKNSGSIPDFENSDPETPTNIVDMSRELCAVMANTKWNV